MNIVRDMAGGRHPLRVMLTGALPITVFALLYLAFGRQVVEMVFLGVLAVIILWMLGITILMVWDYQQEKRGEGK